MWLDELDNNIISCSGASSQIICIPSYCIEANPHIKVLFSERERTSPTECVNPFIEKYFNFAHCIIFCSDIFDAMGPTHNSYIRAHPLALGPTGQEK